MQPTTTPVAAFGLRQAGLPLGPTNQHNHGTERQHVMSTTVVRSSLVSRKVPSNRAGKRLVAAGVSAHSALELPPIAASTNT
jgi:hypothetical protein